MDKIGAKLSADEFGSWITDAPAMAAKAERKPRMTAYSTRAKTDVDSPVADMQSLK
jgi:hypothetical protein